MLGRLRNGFATPAQGMLVMLSLRICPSIILLVILTCAGLADAGEPVIRFDVPALLPVHELIPDGVAPVSEFKVIEIVVPVTSEIRQGDRNNIDEFRFDVSWTRKSFPVADYAPKSQMVSHIEGLIKFDKTRDIGGSISLNGKTDKLEVLSLNSTGDYSNREQDRKSYQEVPQHQTLVASGTIKRGTGAFFRFHPARTEMLEGGREVIIAWRVARDWTGGVLKVECRASGQRKVFGSMSEPIEVGEAFIVPVYLEGHSSALTAATDVVRAERALKQAWHSTRVVQSHSTFRWPFMESALKTFALPTSVNTGASSRSKLPDQWVHRLIQSGDDRYLYRYESMLPKTVKKPAAVFVSARQTLMEMSK